MSIAAVKNGVSGETMIGDYKVADIALAEWGRKAIEIAEREAAG